MMTPQQIAKLRHDVVTAALSDVGKGEVPAGSNSGAWVKSVLAEVGAEAPNPYCAASVCHWLRKGGVKHGPNSASSGEIRKWAIAHHAQRDDPEYGDVGLILDASAWNGVCHTLLIIGGSPDALTCVEANRTSVVHVTHDRSVHDMIILNPYILETL